jgi:hypothetical protein
LPERSAGEQPHDPPASDYSRQPSVYSQKLPSFVWSVAAAAVVFVPAAWDGGADLVARHELAVIGWAIVLLGLLTALLPQALPGRTARPIVIGLIAWAALTAIALLWTSSAERTVEELARVAGYGGLVALGLLAVTRRTWKATATGVFLGAVAVCGLAIVARLDPQAYPDQGAAISGGRLSYPLGYWNALAMWSAMTLAFALSWSANSRQLWVRRAALAVTPVIGLCLYLTYSRGGILVAAFGVAVVIALSHDRFRAALHAAVAIVGSVAVAWVASTQPEIATGTGAEGATVVLVALLGACGVAAVTGRLIEGTRRMIKGSSPSVASLTIAVLAFVVLVPAIYGTLGSHEPVTSSAGGNLNARLLSSNGNRPLYWQVALDDFVDAPLQGTGPGTYGFSWTQAGKSSEEVLDAHSLYIEQLGELGIFGLAAVLLVVTGCLSHAAMPLRLGERGGAAVAMPAGVAVFACAAAIDWMWESTAVTVLALACVVSAGGAAARRVRRRPGQAGARRRLDRRRLWILAAALAGVISIALQIPGLVATQRLRASETALLLGLHGRAQDLASDAVTAEPWGASPFEQRALVELVRGDDTRARADAARAVRNEHLNYRRWLMVALTDRQSGSDRAARRAVRVAHSLAPAAASFQGGVQHALRVGIRGLAP